MLPQGEGRGVFFGGRRWEELGENDLHYFSIGQQKLLAPNSSKKKIKVEGKNLGWMKSASAFQALLSSWHWVETQLSSVGQKEPGK